MLVLGTITALTGCGGSGNSGTTTKTVTLGTPPGTSQLTVLATGGSSSHTLVVTLTVQ